MVRPEIAAQQEQARADLKVIEGKIKNLAALAEATGSVALLDGLKSREREKADIQAKIEHLDGLSKVPTLDREAVRDSLRDLLEDWKGQTPPRFRFAIKAHRRITHIKRLRDVDDDVRWLHERVTELGERLGPVLFQLPPSFRQDLPVLEGFLATLRPLPYVAVEFRHASWHQDATYDLLRRYRVALCIAEDEKSCEPLVHTAAFGYYRLHRLRYTTAQLEAWADHVRSAAHLNPVFCYFTHETGPEAVHYARTLMDLLRPAP